MSTLVRHSLVATALVIAIPAFAAEPPVVQGPEAVEDWYNNGQRFIAESRKLQPNNHRAKNVILFVGDGMGISTLTAARILEGQLKGKPGEENRLSFERFPNVALSKTYSWDQQTSDSAPTMTAITGLVGIPRVKTGMKLLAQAALFADSGPATPSMAPRKAGPAPSTPVRKSGSRG